MKILTWGICLVVFCLPLYLVGFEIFGIPTTVLEVMIYGLFVFWLVHANFDANYKRILMRIFKSYKSVLIPIILILVGVSLATIFSLDLRTSAGIWKGWFVDPLLFFIVVVATIKNSEQIKKILYSLFLSGTVVSVISLIYLIQGKLDPIGRLQAFYNSPNYLAMYLAPILILGFGLWIMVKNRSEKVLLFIVSCFMFYVLWHSHSYGAWLGIIAAVGFSLIVYLFKSKKKSAWVILILTLIIILAVGYFALIQRTSSFDARLIIWQKALEIYKTNPIIGIGPGTFESYFPSFPEWGVPQPHNIYLAFLLQAGIMGFIGFIWLLIWFFKNFQFSIFNFQLLSIMAYILVHGLVDTTYWKNDLAVIFWIIVGLMAVLKIKKLKIQ